MPFNAHRCAHWHVLIHTQAHSNRRRHTHIETRRLACTPCITCTVGHEQTDAEESSWHFTFFIGFHPILPFAQTPSFFVKTLFYRSFHSHFFLSPSYSTVHWTFIIFCLKFDTILPFAQTPSFFVINLFYRLINSHFILSGSYSTVRSNPIFFCHNSILPFVPLPFFTVSILFYHSVNLHLFLS